MDERRWEVQTDGDVKSMTERKLRRRLRGGDLHGDELARPEGASEWSRLWDLPIYRDVVPHVPGEDLRRLAFRRILRGLLGHTLAFFAVLVFLGFPGWGVFWGIGLVMHWVSAAPRLVDLRVAMQQDTPAPIAARAEDPVGAPVDDSALGRAARALEEALDDPEDPLATEVSRSLEAGRELQRRLRALEALLDPDPRPALREEQEALASRLTAAGSDRDREVLEDQVASLVERLLQLDQAAATRDRVAAQLSALVHQLEGLRVALAQRALGVGADGPSLLDTLRGARERAEAGAEVDEALARGRRAAQARRQGT